ncbi:MAG: ParB/RepB/Spo0J family partition protein [Alphaproteobacteria bacterium]|nr:ParB/RepB/Spo0J family partition protein [Alphaproteobacteria bacterium]
MAKITNKALTLKIGQIEKNPILALSTSSKDIEKYERVAQAYGNVAPAIVGQSGNTYRVLSGQARLQACDNRGIREIPVIVTELSNESEQMKLALLLSTVREDSCALSEGVFINALITQHNISRRELMILLKKSKSWISKRQSLAVRLSEDVQRMVRDGTICARSAEEIAKMPKELQVKFAINVARDGLSKTSVAALVSLYLREESDSVTRDAILNTPLSVLDGQPTVSSTRRKEKRGPGERIADNAGFLIRLLYELKGLLAQADNQTISQTRSHLLKLRRAVSDLKIVLDGIYTGVFPGKPQEGGDVL